MAIKVVFPTGQDTVSIGGLYQWDYGQILEIESADLPTIVEVHFACAGMSEAIVHSCSVTNGVATVQIPNRCLEQASNITAWVYEIDDNLGRTIKTITLHVAARVRPSKTPEIPQDVSDRYTELISEVNESVGKLVAGEVVAGSAQHATNADYATSAGNANFATHATTAGKAAKADNSTEAKYVTSYGGITMAEMNDEGTWRVGGLYLILTPATDGTFFTEILFIASAGGISRSVTGDSSNTSGCYYNHVSKKVSGNGAGYPYSTTYVYEIGRIA